VSRFFTPEFFTDPYPTYEELRDEPVRWDEELQGWVLTGYAEVAAALSDPRVSRGGGPQEGDLLTRLLTRMMLFTDPPDHTRLRALANRAFTPRRVEALTPRIAAIVDEELARVDDGEWDLIEGLAYPLPVIVIAEILSLPPEDRDLFKRWSDDVIAVAAGVGDDPERRERALRSADELAEYFAGLVADLRARPNDTLLSGLVQAEENGGRLTEEELLATAILLLMNGHETTTFAIGNGILALLQHGVELARLRSDPGLLGGAAEEILRYDGSVQMRGVLAGEDLELDATQIRADQTLWLAIGATGRDPASSRSRTDSTSTAHPTGTSSSDSALTSASVPRSRALRSNSLSLGCSTTFVGSSWPRTRSVGMRSRPSAVQRPCRSRSIARSTIVNGG